MTMEEIINKNEKDDLQRAELKSVNLVPGDEISPFYLEVVYEFEDIFGIYELRLPKIAMNNFFKNDQLPNIYQWVDNCVFINPRISTSVGLSLEPIHLKGGGHTVVKDVIYEIKTIKEKEQEMTVEEIEKELGHKVKIISEKEKKK